MEILLLPVAIALLIGQQLIAGFIAKNNGRSFKFWFWISFLIPVISIIILLILEDKNPDKKIPLADHVKRN
jgi:MFS family permease